MASITKAALEAQRNALIESVVEYDGCDEGKIEFLRGAGIPDDVIAEYIDIPVGTPDLIAVTLVFRPNEVTPADVRDEIQEVLDNHEMVKGASTYVSAMAVVDSDGWDLDTASLGDNFGCGEWMSLNSWGHINTVAWEAPISVFDA